MANHGIDSGERYGRIMHAAGKGVAGLLAAATLSSLASCSALSSLSDSIDKASGSKPKVAAPKIPGVDGLVGMSGPAKPTDQLASGLQGLVVASKLARNDYVTRSEVNELAKAVGEVTDPTLKAVIGKQIVKSIVVYPPSKSSDLESLIPGLSESDKSEAHSFFAAGVYRKSLDEISYGQAEPEDMKSGIEDTGVQPTKEFLDVAELDDAYGALSRVYNVDSARKAAQDLATSTNPEIQQLLQDTLDYQVGKGVADKYSYGGVTKQDAEKILVTIKSKSVIVSVRGQMNAKDVGDYEAGNNAEVALYDAKDSIDVRISDLRKKAEELSQASFPVSSETIKKISDEETKIINQAEESLGGQVRAFNSALHPETLSPFEKLKDPYHKIDMSSVDSDKVIAVGGPLADTNYSQFAEAYAEGATAGIHFDETAKISDLTRKDMQELYTSVKPLVEAAMQKGALLNVRFVVDTTDNRPSDFDYNPYFDPTEKAVYFIFPRNDSVSMDMARGGLIHELTHALIEDAYAGVNVSKTEVAQMKAACSALSTEARTNFESLMSVSTDILDHLASAPELSSDERQVFNTVKGYIENKTLNKHTDSVASYFDDFGLGCESPNFFDMIVSATKDVNASRASQNLTTTEDVKWSDINDKLKNNKDYKDLQVDWFDAIQYSSLYAKFNESSHTKSTSAVESYLGHSEDVRSSGTEMPASLMSGLLGDTDYMKNLYVGSTTDRKAVIKQSIDAVTGVLVKRYPTLAGTINGAKAKVLS